MVFDNALPQFVPLNQITYVVFYNAEEEATPSFDMWTGILGGKEL